VLCVRLELQTAGLIESVYSLNEADSAGAGQIIETYARRHAALKPPREIVYESQVLKDRFVAALVIDGVCGGVSDFHFR